MERRWWAIVPARSGPVAKSRLVTRPAQQRADLALAFAHDVITALAGAESIDQILIVGDVIAPGTRTLSDPGGGLNSALMHAARSVPDGQPVMVLLGDIPCVRPSDIDAVVKRAAEHDRTFVSDAEGTGTTTLTSREARLLNPHFGVRSRAAHAHSGAMELTDPELFRVRRDVDTEVALWDAVRLGIGAATAQVLTRDTAPP